MDFPTKTLKKRFSLMQEKFLVLGHGGNGDVLHGARVDEFLHDVPSVCFGVYLEQTVECRSFLQALE